MIPVCNKKPSMFFVVVAILNWSYLCIVALCYYRICGKPTTLKQQNELTRTFIDLETNTLKVQAN